MTGDAGDAREEAERIVQLVRETSSLASCSEVVAALAAAIDWCNVTAKGDASIEEIVRVGDGIAEAVSALRAQAGEGEHG